MSYPDRVLSDTRRTVSAFIFPLTRYMLDVIPDDAENANADANVASVSAVAESAASSTDVPAAVETSPVVEESSSDAAEPSSISDPNVGDEEETSTATVAASTIPVRTYVLPALVITSLTPLILL